MAWPKGKPRKRPTTTPMPAFRELLGDDVGLAIVGLRVAAEATSREDLRPRYHRLADRLFHATYGRTFEGGDGI